MAKLGKRSLKNLINVDARVGLLVAGVLARGNVDFTIIDGFRTPEDQAIHFKNGASKLDGVIKKSRHQSGRAIDIIPFPFDGNWDNTKPFVDVMNEFKIVANEYGFKITCGCDWNWKDYPHLEIK